MFEPTNKLRRTEGAIAFQKTTHVSYERSAPAIRGSCLVNGAECQTQRGRASAAHVTPITRWKPYAQTVRTVLYRDAGRLVSPPGQSKRISTSSSDCFWLTHRKVLARKKNGFATTREWLYGGEENVLAASPVRLKAKSGELLLVVFNRFGGARPRCYMRGG